MILLNIYLTTSQTEIDMFLLKEERRPLSASSFCHSILDSIHYAVDAPHIPTAFCGPLEEIFLGISRQSV